MKRYIHILFFGLCYALTSCVMVDSSVDINTAPISGNSGIQIIGAVEDFDLKKVGTRADDGEVADSFISEMTMFIFDEDNKILKGWSKRTVNDKDADGNPTDVTFDHESECATAINIRKANPTFVIDTKTGVLTSLDDDSPAIIYYDNLGGEGVNDLSACKIYIVANAWHILENQIDDIKTLEDLEAITINIDDTLAMPKDENGHYRGFPMIGTHYAYANTGGGTFDLSKGGNNTGAVAKIPLKKLYAKVHFSMQINAIQVVDKVEPRFKIEKVEVFNVPSKARLGRGLDSNGKPEYKTNTDDDYIVEQVGTAAYDASKYYHLDPLEVTQFSRAEIVHTPAVNPADNYLIEFDFYMPEHKVTPNANENTYTGYPANIEPDCKQYYKPMLVGAQRNEDGTVEMSKLATFVRIHGVYTDHNAQIKDVRYDIYLGQDNTDDFTVKRNQLLNNKLVITGLTNYHDAYGDVEGNISIDHRVDVDYKGFNLSMERTAILDAHFEVRPLDIELSPGSTMKITIPEACRSWVGMESDATARDTGNSDLYVNTTDERKGVRKYFTTALVSELTSADSGTIIISNGNDGTTTTKHRIWFYIDENPNVFDKSAMKGHVNFGTTPKTISESGSSYKIDTIYYRNCPVEFKYSGTDNDNTGGGAATVSKTATVNLQQWNLWRVWSADGKRYYDIEHEEEYLNNYASDQKYGETQNGMPFGLEGIQLSHQYRSLFGSLSGGSGWGDLADALGSLFGAATAEEFANGAIESQGISPRYDFYMSRDLDGRTEKEKEQLKVFDYSGLLFNMEIVKELRKISDPKAQIEGITLTENPKSAFAYCYHKNKRNSSGVVENQMWFLPAVDEIEEIAVSAYAEFDKVFQNQKYWSCQPSYTLNSMPGSRVGTYINYGTLKSTFYEDDITRARATYAYTSDGGSTWVPCPSNAPAVTKTISGQIDYVKITGNISFSKLTTDTNTITDFSDVPGNLPRTEKCRIRAVYRSGTK